ncbi:hypothetical protein ACGFMO_32325 [Streptomyces niveus]|uniref:hypothetical protein n=1 Tax=Streptomyces niveus TaxID=193462 RepID=UPI003716A784
MGHDQPFAVGQVAQRYEEEEAEPVSDVREGDDAADERRAHGEVAAHGHQERLGVVDVGHRGPAGDGEQDDDATGQHAGTDAPLRALEVLSADGRRLGPQDTTVLKVSAE